MPTPHLPRSPRARFATALLACSLLAAPIAYQASATEYTAPGTPSDTTAPSTPLSVVAKYAPEAPRGPSVVVTWSASRDNVGVTGYEVQPQFSSSDPNISDPAVMPAPVRVSTPRYEIPARVGSHSFTVVALDAAGNRSGASQVARLEVTDVTDPTTPAALFARVSGYSASIGWKSSTDNIQVSAYDVELRRQYTYGLGTGAPIQALRRVTTPGLALSNLAPDTYVVRVSALDAAGNRSAWTSPVEFLVRDITAPSAPYALEVAASGYHANLLWQPSTDNVGVRGYQLQVERSYIHGDTPPENIAAVQPALITGTSHRMTNLAPDAYRITVLAVDLAGNRSAVSNAVRFVVHDTTAPSVPADVQVRAELLATTLSWSRSTDNVRVTGYEITRSHTLAGEGVGPVLSRTTTQVAGTQTTLTEAELLPGTYTYRVVALDAAGNRSGVGGPVSILVPGKS